MIKLSHGECGIQIYMDHAELKPFLPIRRAVAEFGDGLEGPWLLRLIPCGENEGRAISAASGSLKRGHLQLGEWQSPDWWPKHNVIIVPDVTTDYRDGKTILVIGPLGKLPPYKKQQRRTKAVSHKLRSPTEIATAARQALQVNGVHSLNALNDDLKKAIQTINRFVKADEALRLELKDSGELGFSYTV